MMMKKKYSEWFFGFLKIKVLYFISNEKKTNQTPILPKSMMRHPKKRTFLKNPLKSTASKQSAQGEFL
jgi:hypothetical protein